MAAAATLYYIIKGLEPALTIFPILANGGDLGDGPPCERLLYIFYRAQRRFNRAQRQLYRAQRQLYIVGLRGSFIEVKDRILEFKDICIKLEDSLIELKDGFKTRL